MALLVLYLFPETGVVAEGGVIRAIPFKGAVTLRDPSQYTTVTNQCPGIEPQHRLVSKVGDHKDAIYPLGSPRGCQY